MAAATRPAGRFRCASPIAAVEEDVAVPLTLTPHLRGTAAALVGVGGLALALAGCGGAPVEPVASSASVPSLPVGRVAAPSAPAAPARTGHAGRAAKEPTRPAVIRRQQPATTATGIPKTVEKAYRHAARMFHHYDPACQLKTALLEAIGKIESDHAYNGYVDRKGEALLPIIGPPLDGRPGFALIHASPLGKRLHGDPVFEHAVGPMQFLPGTFADWATAGHRGQETSDPENVYDAAATAARYLCGGGGNLSDPTARHAAVLRYNNSQDYANNVEAWFQAYSSGSRTIPDSKDATAAKRYARADNPPAKAAGPAPAGAGSRGGALPPSARPAPAPGNTGSLPGGCAARPCSPREPKAPDPAPTVGDTLGRLTDPHRSHPPGTAEIGRLPGRTGNPLGNANRPPRVGVAAVPRASGRFRRRVPAPRFVTAGDQWLRASRRAARPAAANPPRTRPIGRTGVPSPPSASEA
jgi:membrane-bound lytic murein transglycosylase B